ncbi:MAG TPA: NADH-quinone oxidoreductase subunit K [Polyangia bacterium]|nr:NADH-quinone oxidoreductase subunit K [Polyangia bacterium]
MLAYLPYAAAAWIFGCGLYGVVRSSDLIHMVMCVAVTQSSTYVLLLAIGYRWAGAAPVFVGGVPRGPIVDPVVQALGLTDVVVEATVMALLLALAVQVHRRTGTLDPERLRIMKG